MIYRKTYESPIGKLFLAAGDEALIGLWIQGQKYFPERLFSEQAGVMDCTERDCGILAQTEGWLDQYFAGDRPDPAQLKLTPGMAPGILAPVSEFRRHVWKLLLEIPYGEVLTYGELARRLARNRGLVLTGDKIFQFPHSTDGIIGQPALCGKENAITRQYNSMSAQAVGGAVGHNPLSIIIPCHRVVGADGSLTGYAAGVERKRWLLRLEGALEE